MTGRPAAPPRIEVEIGSLVVDDPALARPAEIAAALEQELTRLAAERGIAIRSRRPVATLPATLSAAPTTRGLGAAIASAVAGELTR